MKEWIQGLLKKYFSPPPPRRPTVYVVHGPAYRSRWSCRCDETEPDWQDSCYCG